MDTETRLNGRTDGERPSTLGHGAYSQIIAVALLGIIVSFLLFGIIRHQTLENNRLRYLDAADTQQRIISHAINSNVEGLFDLYYPFALFPDIGWTDFQVMARAVLQHHPDMQAVEWVPRVTEADRLSFVTHMRRIFPGYDIEQISGPHFAMAHNTHSVHYPVAYAMPYVKNLSAVGIDLGSEAKRATAIQQAMDSGRAVATGKLILVQGERQRPGFLTLVPVYRKGMPTRTVADRRENLYGFVVGVYVIEDIINSALDNRQREGVATWILDKSSPAANQLLYFSDGHGGKTQDAYRWVMHLALQWPVFRQPLKVARRRWEVDSRITPWFHGETPLYWSWIALFAGLGGSLLGCAYLYFSRRYAHHRRSAEASLANSREQLVVSEQRYRSLFDNNPDAIYSLDLEGRITAANHGAEQLTGYSVDKLIGKCVFGFVILHDQLSVRKHHEKATRGEPQNFDVNGRRRDDNRFVANVTNLPIIVDGRIVGVYGIAKNITQSRQTEEGLRLAANALENTAEGVMITDAKQRIVSVNKAFTAITGFSEAEVIGQSPAILLSDVSEDANYEAKWNALADTGHWQGEIWGRKKGGEIYPTLQSISAVRGDDGRITHYVGVFNDISESKGYQEQLEFLAHHDALTTLPNRVLLHERIQEAISRAHRYHGQFALLFIDLDRFKTINDSLGHEVGDQLLREVARRLIACVRETDTVARQGGDEFIVLLSEIKDVQDAAPVAQKILDMLASTFCLAGHDLGISASIGISCYPHDGKEMKDLLSNADIAMYHAKELGKNNYQYFAASMNAQALEHLLMSNSLRAALANDEFVLHYQPIIEIRTNQIVGAEALIRWRHPQLGLLAPANFIPLAEETGMITSIGEWTLRTVCEQAAAWERAGFGRLSIAMNLSAKQFQQGDLSDLVHKVLNETGAVAECLKLEVTESMVMRDPQATQRNLERLHAMGLAISIDDFGTGYSSLSYLKHFPIDYVKIDRSFIRDIPNDAEDIAIVQAIIALARGLRMKVIAEGIEIGAQRDMLAAEGCDEGQGFFYSRPLPPAEIELLLKKPLAILG